MLRSNLMRFINCHSTAHSQSETFLKRAISAAINTLFVALLEVHSQLTTGYFDVVKALPYLCCCLNKIQYKASTTPSFETVAEGLAFSWYQRDLLDQDKDHGKD